MVVKRRQTRLLLSRWAGYLQHSHVHQLLYLLLFSLLLGQTFSDVSRFFFFFFLLIFLCCFFSSSCRFSLSIFLPLSQHPILSLSSARHLLSHCNSCTYSFFCCTITPCLYAHNTNAVRLSYALRRYTYNIFFCRFLMRLSFSHFTFDYVWP